jgi:ribulose 1,5-bisphosphate carboxylase large subunit-like protein
MYPMNSLAPDLLWFDLDAREEHIRRVVSARLEATPPPASFDHIVATYFFAFRSMKLAEAVKEIAYHATSGIKHPPPGSLLEACTAIPLGVDEFDASGRLGLLHVGFPLKMMLHPNGYLTSTDILHTTASAIIFDVFENLDSKLVSLQIPEAVLRSFPGPAYGPQGVRRLTGFGADEIAFGTILKPTAGITPGDVGRLVAEVAACLLFLFVKEDEDLYPDLDYSPVRERTRRAVAAIAQARPVRGGKGLLFAPHVTGAPHEILETVFAVLEEGATALMFSETFAGGSVRMVREATKSLPNPPALYGHNAGIGTRTRSIYREVIDLLARLDGIDFRQTAPVRPGVPFLKPYGLEWEASEQALSQPLGPIRPTMIARAGALDQGNIGLNLEDAGRRGLAGHILFLAGSAINSIKNAAGKADPALGATAMLQAIEVHRSGELAGLPPEDHLPALWSLAQRKGLSELAQALPQRYPALSSQER